MRRALLVLLLLEAFCFGPSLTGTGFYLDDWVFLHKVMPQGRADVPAGIRNFSKGGFWTRPAQMLHYPLLIRFGQMSPWRYRLVLLGLETLLGTLIFLLLSRLTGNRGLALSAAVLASAFPSHEANHFWWNMSTQMLAVALAFGSLLAHLRWTDPAPAASRPPSRRWLLAGQGLYLAALLEYEAVALLPLALAAALWAGSRSARGALRSCSPYLSTLALATLFQRVLVPGLLEPSPRQVAFSIRHLLEVYEAALRCSTTGLLRMTRDSLEGGFKVFPAYAWPALLAGSCALAALIELERAGARNDGPCLQDTAARGAIAVRTTAAAGFVVFAANYLPYVLTGGYTPTLYGVISRVNFGGALGCGMMLAALYGLLPRKALRFAALSTTLAAFCLCHWASGSRWSTAWRLQRSILADLIAQLPGGDAVILLKGTRPWVLGAPVFLNHYDATQALRLATGRVNIEANWMQSGELRGKSISVLNGDMNVFRYPVGRVYIYDGATRKLFPLAAVGAGPLPGDAPSS